MLRALAISGEREYDEPMPEPPDAPYLTTAQLLSQVRDLYELREQFRHRAGGPEDPLEELLRRFPAPGA